jgi:cobalt-precorrin-7 (C5)-methyltransferase
MIRVIGMGPGNIKFMTLDSVDKVKQSSVVLAFGRISKTAELLRDDVIKISRVDEILKYLDGDKDIAILASGDPCFYGILEYLKSKGILIDEVTPGLSSFQYMMSKLKKSWHCANFVSLHGREEDINSVIKNNLSVILTDSKNTPNYISKALHAKGIRGRLYAGFNLSYEDECIITKNIGEEIEKLGSLAVVVIENEMG